MRMMFLRVYIFFLISTLKTNMYDPPMLSILPMNETNTHLPRSVITVETHHILI